MILRRLSAAFALGTLLACSPWCHAQENPGPEVKPLQLELGKTIEDVLTPNHTKSFQVAIAFGQYAEIAIELKESPDVIAHLLDPRGKEELVVYTIAGESVAVPVLASTGGNYRLDVRRRGGGEGHFRITLTERREGVPEDQKRVEVQRVLAEAVRLEEDRSAQGLRARLEKYQTALALWRQIGDQRNEALGLLQIGKVYNDLHENSLALEYLHQAFSLGQALGLKGVAAQAVMSLGATSANQGDIHNAVEYFRQALALSREVRDKFGEAFALMALGRNDPTVDALDYFQRALDLFGTLENTRGEAYALNQLGQKYVALGRQQEGMERLRQCLEIARASNNSYEEAYALLHLAEGYALQGEMRKALDFYLQAVPLHHARGDSWGEAQAFMEIGSMYLSLGEMDKALDYSRRALPIWQNIQHPDSEALTLIQIGSAYSALGDAEAAFPNLQRALLLCRAQSNRVREGETLTAMGDNHVQQAKLQDALQDYDQAIAVYRTGATFDPTMHLGEAMALQGLGSVQVSLGQAEEALQTLSRARELLATTGHQVESEASVLYELARAERAANHLQEALARATAAVDLTERLRGNVAGVGMRTSYVALVRDRYEILIGLLMQLHRQHPAEGYDVKALQASERSRARGLLDLLNESHADIHQGVDPALLERERTLRASLTFKAAYRLQMLSKTHTDQQGSNLENEISAINSQYEENEAQIRARSPHYAALTQPQPLTLTEIQRLLDPGTALLEYSLGAEKSFLWVVRPDTLSSYELPKRAEVEALARRAHQELSVNNPGGGREATLALGRMLLRQAEQNLASKRLVIVAEGALEYIPFAALRASQQGAPMVVDHEIVNLPSASTLAALRGDVEGRVTPPMQVAVLADPVFSRDDARVTGTTADSASLQGGGTASHLAEVERSASEAGLLRLERLPATRREAQTIIALAGKEASLQALDFDASVKTATSPDLGLYRIIHFASHTLLNSSHPELSGIVLSLVDKNGGPQEGFLQVQEVFNLKLNADLVVLSACQTALGKQVRGEGLVGLARAFMYAGAPRVVASLWRVPDQATAELMQHFYKALLAEGLSPAAALRQAQLDLRREKRWSAPYYWAGFALQGEWK